MTDDKPQPTPRPQATRRPPVLDRKVRAVGERVVASTVRGGLRAAEPDGDQGPR